MNCIIPDQNYNVFKSSHRSASQNQHRHSRPFAKSGQHYLLQHLPWPMDGVCSMRSPTSSPCGLHGRREALQGHHWHLPLAVHPQSYLGPKSSPFYHRKKKPQQLHGSDPILLAGLHLCQTDSITDSCQNYKLSVWWLDEVLVMFESHLLLHSRQLTQ